MQIGNIISFLAMFLMAAILILSFLMLLLLNVLLWLYLITQMAMRKYNVKLYNVPNQPSGWQHIARVADSLKIASGPHLSISSGCTCLASWDFLACRPKSFNDLSIY